MSASTAASDTDSPSRRNSKDVVSCPKGPHMQILVKTQSEESFPLYIQTYIDTIDAVRAKIEARTGCLAKDQKLKVDGKELTTIDMISHQCVIDLSMNSLDESKSNDNKSQKEHDRALKHLNKLYSRLATDLLETLHNYKEWRLQAMLQMKTNREPTFELQEMSLGTMPLATVAVCLVPLLEFQSWFQRERRDSKQFDMLRGVIIEWLSHVEVLIQNRLSASKKTKSDVSAESLSALYLDEEKCAAMAELLMLNLIHPSRTEVLLCDNSASVASHTRLKPEYGIRRGSLREQVVCGRNVYLLTAVDMFVEFLESNLPKEHSPKGPALPNAMKSYVHLVWHFLDMDGDGLLSQDESLEFCHVTLGRAALGRLLITCVCVAAADDPNNQQMAPVARESLVSVIPSLVLTFAGEGLRLLSEKFWHDMDFDGDGVVTKFEFCEHFPQAFWKTFILPLAVRLSAKSSELRKPSKAVERKTVDIIAKELENDFCARNCTGAGAFHSCMPEPFPVPPNPQTDNRLKVGSSAKIPREFAVHERNDAPFDETVKRDEVCHQMKILLSPDEEGYAMHDNLNDVDETVVKSSSKFSCNAACYNGLGKRSCLPKHSNALKQQCSDPLDACRDSSTDGNAKEKKE